MKVFCIITPNLSDPLKVVGESLERQLELQRWGGRGEMGRCWSNDTNLQ